MTMINHQNNFATNLTSSVSAGAGTSPLDLLPTVDAPFYLALDATNVNGKYEVVYVTAKTATNVNHAALSYDHTTAEEVRMVVPAAELDTFMSATNLDAFNGPAGFLINGKIVPSVASNNLTCALKTLAGNDPSATDPVYCRIGDTIQPITAALSVTTNAGTNWFASGSSEMATLEVDYFVYLGYNATDGVTIGFARVPYGYRYSSFSTTNTNQAYCAISTITTAAATDPYVLVARFAATLSAGAGYTWTVPTFTPANMIQRPIYETRWLTWTPQYTNVTTGNGTSAAYYQVVQNNCFMKHQFTMGSTSSISGLPTITTPLTISTTNPFNTQAIYVQGTTRCPGVCMQASTTSFVYRADNASATYSTLTNLSSSVPFTWAASDYMNSEFMQYI